MNRLPSSLFGFLLALLAPALATVLHVPDVQVYGVMPGVVWPAFTWANLRDEHYTADATQVFEQHMGLRGVYTYLGNSLRLHMLGETRPSYGPQVGKHGVIYHSEDLIFHSQRKAKLPSTADIQNVVHQVADLQRVLSARGQALVPVLTPGKGALYPHDMHDAQTFPVGANTRRESDVWVYDALRDALASEHVAYVDARARLTDGTFPVEQVWGREARHWTHFGACLIVRDVRVKYTQIAHKELPDYPCVLDQTRPQDMLHSDYDLWRLMNVWGHSPHANHEPNVVHPGIGDGAAGPSLFTIGTSFFETIAWDAVYSQAFKRVQMNYYNRRIFRVYPDGEELVVQPHTEAWRSATQGHDLYVLDMFEVYFPGTYLKDFVTEFGQDLGAQP